MEQQTKVVIASDAEHEQVFAEIYVGEKFVAAVSRESGPGSEIVELPGAGLVESCILRKVPIAVLTEALNSAVKRLQGS